MTDAMSQLASAPRRPSSTSSGSPANESCGLRVANNSTTASTSTPRATNANACGGPGQPLRVIGHAHERALARHQHRALISPTMQSQHPGN